MKFLSLCYAICLVAGSSFAQPPKASLQDQTPAELYRDYATLQADYNEALVVLIAAVQKTPDLATKQALTKALQTVVEANASAEKIFLEAMRRLTEATPRKTLP